MVKVELLSQSADIYLITSTYDDKALFDIVKKQRGVQALEFNYQLEKRIKPNDPRLSEQYYLNLIKAPETWEIITGGKDYEGKDIVVGIIDDGFELAHEDLQDNIYTNPDEIPNDGKDNDNNGYKDDVNGWNIRSSTATHDVKSHGSYILGAIGAKGNNLKGISGVNWNVKLLPVTIGSVVSDVIKGYEYLINEKTQYISSGGTKGSNIVVTNYSGGLAKAFAADHPTWCAIYERLGALGTLSVAATSNDNDNVEVVGDMPSTCSSPYLIVVNSTNKADEKDASTGFGNVSVDISAPGELILTTELTSKGKYKTESGTSLSTPIVAGAVALLYSIKCSSFSSFVKSDGKNAALAVKDIIMSSVDKKSSLAGKTVSGGRINISNALQQLLKEYCTKELAPVGNLKINQVAFDLGQLTLDYLSPDTKELSVYIYDTSGKLVYSSSFLPPVFGVKKITLNTDQYLAGMFYYCTLTDGQNVVSRGFAARQIK
jgi:subtilisin family serine protease